MTCRDAMPGPKVSQARLSKGGRAFFRANGISRSCPETRVGGGGGPVPPTYAQGEKNDVLPAVTEGAKVRWRREEETV